MFNRYSLNRVHDDPVFREGNAELKLHVDGDPYRMVTAMGQAMDHMRQAADGTEEDQKASVMEFAESVFGAEQAQQIFDFYRGQIECVAGICGQYLAKRLGKLIAKRQKRK